MPRLDAFRNLLTVLFDAQELRSLMRGLELADHLPEGGSFVNLAEQCTLLFNRHGLIGNAIFLELLRIRPAREKDILAVQEQYVRIPSYIRQAFLAPSTHGDFMGRVEARPIPSTHIAVCVGNIVDGRPLARDQWDGIFSDADVLRVDEFSTIQDLLNYIYERHLRTFVAPFTYGVDWALCAEPEERQSTARRLILPAVWLNEQWQETSPHWSSTELQAAGIHSGHVYSVTALNAKNSLPCGGAPALRLGFGTAERSKWTPRLFFASLLQSAVPHPKMLAHMIRMGNVKIVDPADIQWSNFPDAHVYLTSPQFESYFDEESSIRSRFALGLPHRDDARFTID